MNCLSLNRLSVMMCIPVLLVGGTEIQTLSLIRVLSSMGYDTYVCCYYECDGAILSKLRATNTKVILMDLARSDGVLTLIRRLWKVFEEVKPDLVHVQYLAPGLISIIAARLSRVKRVFATVHQPGRPYGLKAKILIRIAAYLCDAFFCNSRSVEESWFGNSEVFNPLKKNGKRKHFTIYNAVDVEKIDRIVDQTDTQAIKKSLNVVDKKVIGVIGRLRKEKGQIFLLESMKTIVEGMANVILLAVGDGPDRQSLEEEAKKLGIAGHVRWLGQKDHDEVLRLYSIMDVVVVPSVFEGFGLAAAEAMAAGKPVVASNVDGLCEVIQDRITGFLVPPGNIELLAQAVLDILNNPAKAASMSDVGRERVEQEFSFSRFQRHILGAYSQYLSNQKS